MIHMTLVGRQRGLNLFLQVVSLGRRWKSTTQAEPENIIQYRLLISICSTVTSVVFVIMYRSVFRYFKFDFPR